MADLPGCDQEIFKNGQPLLIADTGLQGGNVAMEEWVKALAEASGQQADWHYSGGRAQVLFLGERDKLLTALETVEQPETIRIMQLYGEGAGGLHRRGVTPTPDGAIAGFEMNGETVYMVEPK